MEEVLFKVEVKDNDLQTLIQEKKENLERLANMYNSKNYDNDDLQDIMTLLAKSDQRILKFIHLVIENRVQGEVREIANEYLTNELNRIIDLIHYNTLKVNNSSGEEFDLLSNGSIEKISRENLADYLLSQSFVLTVYANIKSDLNEQVE